MTDTAKSAREIIADQLESDDGKGGWAFDMEADRIIAALRAKDLEIRPIAPVATPAVGEVSKEVANLLRSNDLDWSNLSCRQKADRILSLIAPRLKAEGLREAAAICNAHVHKATTDGADAYVATILCADILARADAMEKGEA